VLEVGKTYYIQNPNTGEYVTRTILSIEGTRVFYRKSETDKQGHGKIGQCTVRAFEKLIEGQADIFDYL